MRDLMSPPCRMVSRPLMPVDTRASRASARALVARTLAGSGFVVRDLAMRVEEVSHECSLRDGRRERQDDGEGRAGAGRADDVDMAAHCVDELAHRPQPDADPAMLLQPSSALEALE